MSDGQRVKIRSGPWPERIGCEGVIVEAPKGYNRYPWHGRDKSEVIVLLDDDPLGTYPGAADGSAYGGQAWTCCIGREDVESL